MSDKRSVSFPTQEDPNEIHRVLFADIRLRIRYDTQTEQIDVEVLKDEPPQRDNQGPESQA